MQSFISETRQPFARRGDKTCVYYGIRGNSRSQYLYDKSCGFEGANLGDEVINPVGVLWNGALGDEVINPVGVLWNGTNLGITNVQPTGALFPRGPLADGETMPTKTKVLLGLGAVALIAGVATIALSDNITKGGGRRRKRRR